MAKLTDEIRIAIEKTQPTCLATSDPSGVPNLIYVSYIRIVNEETLVVADNKFEKTRKNLDSNPRMSVTVLDPDTRKAFQLKCITECVTEGHRYNEIVDWVHEKHPDMTPKAAFYLKIDEIYSGADKLN